MARNDLFPWLKGVDENKLLIKMLLTDLSTDEEIARKQVLNRIKESIEKFLPYCERIIDSEMTNIEVMSDSLTIENMNFDFDNLSGGIELSFDIDVFYPCDDMRYQDHRDPEAVLDFDIIDNVISFDITLPPKWMPDQAMEDY